MAVTFIIDGYNLLHRAYPERLAEGRLEDAREFLERKLRGLQASRKGGCNILLVYDGADHAFGEGGRIEGFQIIYSGGSETADDVILDLCRRLEGGEDVTVVTSDLGDIGFRVRGLRCRHLRSEDFARLLESGVQAPPGGREKPELVSRDEVDGWLREFDLHPDADDDDGE